MINPLRPLVSAALAAVLAGTLAYAQTQAPQPEATAGPADATELPADLAAALGAPLRWSSSTSLEAGFGYKDNVLLSHANEEASPLARAALEGFIWRLPPEDGSLDYVGLLHASGTRFFKKLTTDHEAEATLQLEARYRPFKPLKVSLALQGYYLDEIFDISDSDFARVPTELKVAGGVVRPTVRWNFLANFWVEAQGAGKRESYDDNSDNNHLTEATGRLGWTASEHFELSASASESWRAYDTHEQYEIGGRLLDGTRLKVIEHEYEVRADNTWDKAEHWKTTTRVGLSDYGDNGSGFLDYQLHRAAEEIDFTGEKWSLHLEGAAKRLHYNFQTVGLGLNPPARIKEEFSVQARVERKIAARWSLFAEYNWQRNRCNDPIASYIANEGLLGARWSWEK